MIILIEQPLFGMKTKSASEPAKELIFPVDMNNDSEEGNALYKRSHGSYAPGEQRRRNYDWGTETNPATTRFGRKGDTIAFNGVSKNIAEVLQGNSLGHGNMMQSNNNNNNNNSRNGQRNNNNNNNEETPIVNLKKVIIVIIIIIIITIVCELTLTDGL
jgi:hypothetical protein